MNYYPQSMHWLRTSCCNILCWKLTGCRHQLSLPWPTTSWNIQCWFFIHTWIFIHKVSIRVGATRFCVRNYVSNLSQSTPIDDTFHDEFLSTHWFFVHTEFLSTWIIIHKELLSTELLSTNNFYSQRIIIHCIVESLKLLSSNRRSSNICTGTVQYVLY